MSEKLIKSSFIGLRIDSIAYKDIKVLANNNYRTISQEVRLLLDRGIENAKKEERLHG